MANSSTKEVKSNNDGLDLFSNQTETYEGEQHYEESEGLDDPYLELFDRINQLELEVRELQNIISMFRVPKFVGKVSDEDKKEFLKPAQQEFKFFE